MTDDPAPLRWKLRLQLAAGLGLMVLLIMFVRARVSQTGVERDRALLRTTLTQLVAMQEEHYARTGRYVTTLDASLPFRAADHLVVRFYAPTDQQWRATVTDPTLSLPPNTCGVFLGDPVMSPHRAVLQPGEPACW